MAECKTCGISFEPKRHSRVGKFCSLDCYYALGAVGPRKATVKGPRMRTAIGHPLAPPSGIVAISRLNLYEKIGPGSHRCHWCGTRVAWVAGGSPGIQGSLLVDHLDWDNQNDEPSNLVPACNACNSKRAAPGKRQKIQPGEPTLMVGKYRTRAKEVACAECGEMFLTLPSRPKKYCSSRCANGRAIFHPHRRANQSKEPAMPYSGDRHHSAKLRDADIREIRRRLANGELQKTLADDYKVSKSTISLIARNPRWRRTD